MSRAAATITLVLASIAAAAILAFARGWSRPAAPTTADADEVRRLRAELERKDQVIRAMTEQAVALGAGGAGAPTADAEEVRRLRADLERKDQAIRAVTEQAAAGELDRAAAVAAARERAQSPAARAVAKLDARLDAGPASPAATAELERALRSTLDSTALGPAHVDGLRCTETLCRVALSAATPDELAPAVEAIAEHAPKSFPAVITYPTNGGGRAIYIGRSSADLTPDDPTARP